MATITKVDKQTRTWQGKTKTSYIFTLSDGKSGYASNDSPWEFKEGEEVSYTCEVKKSTRGEYNLFTFTRAQNASISSPSASPVPPEQKTPKSDPPVPPRLALVGNTLQGLKAEACMRAMEYVIGAFRDERIPWEEVGKKQRECAAILCAELDGIFTDKA